MVRPLVDAIRTTFELTPIVHVLERGTLAREFERTVKAVRFFDRRAKPSSAPRE